MTLETETTTGGTVETTTTDSTPRSKRFSHQNFLTKVGRSEFLLKTLQEDTPEKLAGFGITPEAVTAFENVIATVKLTDQEQEDAKASLKTLTARLRGEQKQMENQYATFKRKIKAESPMEEWKRYGFSDKQ